MTPNDVFDKFGEIKSDLVLLLALGTLVVLFVTGIQARTFRVVPSLALWALGLLVLQALASTLLSGNPVIGAVGNAVRHEGFLMIFANSLLFLTAYQVASGAGSHGPTLVARVLVMASVPVFLYAFIQMMGLDPILWEAFRGAGGRVFSSLGNPLFLGAYGVMVVLVGLGLWLGSTRPAGVVWTVIAGGGIATVVMTGARASWVGLFFGVMVLVAVCWGAGHLRRFLLGVGLAAILAATIVVLAVVAVPGGSGGAVLRQSTATLADPGASRNAGRLAIWSIAGRMIVDHPIVGIGPDEMGKEFEAYRTDAFNNAEGVTMVADKPHGSVLKWAVETGLPGALLFLGLVVLILGPSGCRLLRSPPPVAGDWVRVGVWAAAAAYLAQSLVTVTAIGVDGVWWILLGLIGGAEVVPRLSLAESRLRRSGCESIFLRLTALKGMGMARNKCGRAPMEVVGERLNLNGRGRQAGFTLIELLVVIIIIAILAAIAIPTYLGARVNAQNAAAYTLVRNALTAIESTKINMASYMAITAGDLSATEPSIQWNIATQDLVDPSIPAVTTNVTAQSRLNAVDFYAESATRFDVACVSAGGDRYGIQVETTGNASADYIKVKSIDGHGSVGW